MERIIVFSWEGCFLCLSETVWMEQRSDDNASYMCNYKFIFIFIFIFTFIYIYTHNISKNSDQVQLKIRIRSKNTLASEGCTYQCIPVHIEVFLKFTAMKIRFLLPRILHAWQNLQLQCEGIGAGVCSHPS